ncbi:MAG: hypothetical protein NXY57DRAFT_689451 [Lentinula lateritia]|uniref:Uncharacterized protein n=1 Tax=Lentinula lateritia TaxID=40482 RepID=A0ABQ8VQ89_9AGAR|nr:MAG: hypothetical protein NXY57DRAFT_689451 [Lentinula lateritia]KAJ4498553.1 hypothetical protein C8R41DRAFT_900940 [Lentinula lateritia]
MGADPEVIRQACTITMLKCAATSESPPALPVIMGDEATDLTLAIYTPHSPCLTITVKYSNDRLAELGKQVLTLVVTLYLFDERPFLTATDIEERRDSILDDDEILSWLGLYPDMEKRFLQRAGLDPLHSREEMCVFFLSYVGAIYISNGRSLRPVLENWIAGLISLDSSMSGSSGGSSSSTHSLPPLYLDTPPLTPANSPLSSPSTPNSPLSSRPIDDKTLELVNQTAQQKGVLLQYVDEREGGLDHDPAWLVHCKINGQEKGCGRGKKKKVAMALAARQAYIAMDW